MLAKRRFAPEILTDSRTSGSEARSEREANFIAQPFYFIASQRISAFDFI